MEPQGLGCGVKTNPDKYLYEEWASMEPQGLGCGVFRRSRQVPREAFRFNGATGFRLWSLVGTPGHEKRENIASMEPQGLGCGVRLSP